MIQNSLDYYTPKFSTITGNLQFMAILILLVHGDLNYIGFKLIDEGKMYLFWRTDRELISP